MSEFSVNIPDIHIGNTIVQYLKDSGKTQGYLAKLLKMPTSNLTRLLKRKSMETDRLFQISVEIEYNFFAIYGCHPDKTVDYRISTPDLGNHIEKKLVDIKMPRSEFAEKLGIKPTDVSRLLKRTSFDTDKLVKISQILNYNFFWDFYHGSPEEQNLDPLSSWQKIRLDELLIENERQKERIFNLELKVKSLKDKLAAAGIED